MCRWELQEKKQDAYDAIQFIGTPSAKTIGTSYPVHLGEAIAKEAEKRGVCQDILREVNIGREAAKSGLPPEELHDAIVKLSAKTSLHIRGLMAIPPVADEKIENQTTLPKMRIFDEKIR